MDRNIVVHDTFFLERLRDFKFAVPPPGGIWLIMTILTQYPSSNLVPPPHRNSSQVPPQDRKKPCIFNPGIITQIFAKKLLFHILEVKFDHEWGLSGEQNFERFFSTGSFFSTVQKCIFHC